MQIQRLDPQSAVQTAALLGELRVSLFGVCSPVLNSALVADALSGDIDGRVAADANEVRGVVLAAPASYWRSAPLRHWDVAMECVRARLAPGRSDSSPHASPAAGEPLLTGIPPRTWNEPGDAWRIIFVGTALSARGQGIAAGLYRSLMAERSLVARVALDNAASIRLHRSLGWEIYRDGDVAMAVHLLARHDRPMALDAV
jgi:hypothetical protein